MSETLKKQYDPTFNFMKGVCILLMIVCHSINHNFRIIYSFHMPLFFLLAGYFAKDVICSWNVFWTHTKKNALRLLLPYLVTMLALSAWGLWQYIEKGNINFFLRPLLSMFWMGGDELFSNYGIISVNALWFLVALFWTRELFYIILWCLSNNNSKYNDILVVIVCGILTFLVSYIKTKISLPPLPLSLLQGINALLFYSIGWYVKRNTIPTWIKVCVILCWPLAGYFGQIEMYGCYYKIFPLDVLGACGGTLLLYHICSKMLSIQSKHKILSLPNNFLQWCGINSLLILCVHEFDLRSGFFWSIKCRIPLLDDVLLRGGQLIVIHLVIAIFGSWLLASVPIVNRVFSRK